MGAHGSLPTGWQQVIGRNQPGKATFFAETSSRQTTRKLLAGRTALASLPDDPVPIELPVDLLNQGQSRQTVLAADRLIARGPSARYRAVIVDEAQDLDAAGLRLIRARPGPSR